MRHRKAGRRLGRNRGQRKALMRNLAASLVKHEKIETTDQKCKELRPLVEKLITKAKRGSSQIGEEDERTAGARSLHARRRILRVIPRRDLVEKIFSVLVPRYQDRPGGYTRIVKVGPRPGDNADMSIIELVDRPVEES